MGVATGRASADSSELGHFGIAALLSQTFPFPQLKNWVGLETMSASQKVRIQNKTKKTCQNAQVSSHIQPTIYRTDTSVSLLDSALENTSDEALPWNLRLCNHHPKAAGNKRDRFTWNAIAVNGLGLNAQRRRWDLQKVMNHMTSRLRMSSKQSLFIFRGYIFLVALGWHSKESH